MNFLEFFWQMTIDMWTHDLAGKFMAVLLYGTFAMVFFLIAWLVFELADTCFLSYKEGKGTVISKRFDPEHTSTHMQTISTGKTTIMIPQTIHYPDRYFIVLGINRLYGEKQVEKKVYDKLSIGNVIEVLYSKNRFTKRLTFQ